jgi:hypothetical protein
MNDIERAAIVAEAKTWIDTPYRGWSCMKGCGCDCMQLLAGVFLNTGHVTKEALAALIPQTYSLNIGQHKEDTEYIDGVGKFMQEIPEAEVKPGDVVMYKLDLAFTHAAIVVEWPTYIIHALARHGVCGAHGIAEPIISNKPRRFFTIRKGN